MLPVSWRILLFVMVVCISHCVQFNAVKIWRDYDSDIPIANKHNSFVSYPWRRR